MAQTMSSGLKLCLVLSKGRNFGVVLTGDAVQPVKGVTETDATYNERLDDWVDKNHQILTWFRNTSIPSIGLQFGRFQEDASPAKATCEFLKQRYSTTGLAHQYQLQSHFHQMRQDSGQSINDFLSQVYLQFGIRFLFRNPCGNVLRMQ